MRNRAIQERSHNDKREKPPGLAHLPPGGQNVFYETQEQYVQDDMPQKRKRTMWVSLFHMVAELAVWQADLAIWFA
eukprot:4204994-Amphidinium_carterae.1